MIIERTRQNIRLAILFCVWLALVWIGRIAIHYRDTGLLAIYVVVAATGAVTLIYWIWSGGRFPNRE